MKKVVFQFKNVSFIKDKALNYFFTLHNLMAHVIIQINGEVVKKMILEDM